MAAGPVTISMVNDLDQDVVVRLERAADRMDVVTASRYRASDDRNVHAELVALQREVSDAAEIEGGAIVKLQLEGVLAVFTDPVAATRAAIRLVTSMGVRAKVAVHTGTAMLTTINQRLDYFGRTVHATSQLLAETAAAEIAVSEDIQRADPRALDAVREAPFELVAIVQRTAIGLRYRLRD